MVIRFIGGSSLLNNTIVEWNKITLENLTNEMRKNELVFDADLDRTIISFSFRVPAGRIEGTLDETTAMDVDPSSVVIFTQQPRETKARAYSAEELADVIAEAKAALVSNEFNSLKSACRELRQVSEEVAKLIGNYTHYSKSTSDMFNAVERAVKFLSPEVVEVGAEDLQAIITRIEAIEAKVDRIANETSVGNVIIELTEKVAELKSDVDFINQHFDLK